MTTMLRRAAILIAAALAFVMLGTATAFAATDTVEPEPVIVLRTYRSIPGTLGVGAKFKLEIYLDNVVDVDADNLVVTAGLSAATGTTATPSAETRIPHVVVLGTNTRFVGTVVGNAKNKLVAFDLMCSPNSYPGPYSVPITVEYDNPNGGRTTTLQTVGLTFTRTLVFDVGALSYPRETTAGAPFKVSVSVKNTNDFPVDGVMLSFDATGTDWVTRETTIGVLAPGAIGKLDATGIAQTPGLLTVTMTLTYQDDYNVTKRITRDFVIRVGEKPATKAADEPVSGKTPGQRVVLFLRALLGLGG